MTNHAQQTRHLIPNVRAALLALTIPLLLFAFSGEAIGQKKRRASTPRAPALRPLPESVMLPIMQAEDTRSWSGEVAALLFNADARVRVRAALAAGRIGDD